ncbi:MAG: glycine cleavage system protein GcvH [Acidimicrobiia bacterium]
MQFPVDLRYSKEHEWVRVDGAQAQIGITDFAQDALGDVVFVQLPDVGLEVIAGASCAEVESTKSVSEIFAPVSGVVIAVNAQLDAAPELVNADAYGAGWLMRIELSDSGEVNDLMDAAAYEAFIAGA